MFGDSKPFVLREDLGAIEVDDQCLSIDLTNDKDLLISKLQDDLAQERELNKKHTNELASLTAKIESHKKEEKRLLQTIKKYRFEIDLLSTNLNSYQSLSDNYVKLKQELIALNQNSNDAHKSKSTLICMDTNPSPKIEILDTTNSIGK